MKRLYISLLLGLATLAMNAQIVQVTDINKDGDSGIGQPYAWKGKLYFEADPGKDSVEINGKMYPIGDELYVYDGDSAYLLANLNLDTVNNNKNSDPQLFIEYKDKLYFRASGDYGIVNKELFVTDGTPEGTELAFEFNTAAKKGGNPQEFFIFNDILYMNAHNGVTTQLWGFDGDTAKIYVDESSNGFYNPFSPTIDSDKVWLKAMNTNKKNQLCIFNGDSITYLTDLTNDQAFIYSGVLYNDGYLYGGRDDDKDRELWFSNGTPEGTVEVIDIDTAGKSDPKELTIYNEEVFFFAKVDGKTQLWKSNATAAGTQAVLIPTDTVDVGMKNLTSYNERLYFTLTNQAKKDELWVFDGATSSKVSTIGTSPKGFIEVDGLLFFISGEKLWYTEGYEDATSMVDSVATGVEYANANNEYAVIGTTLYFTADDANGNDDIYAFDVSIIEKKYQPIVLDDIKGLHVFNEELYFEAEDQNNNIGDELYKQTAEGEIELVKDINQDPYASITNSDPKNFVEFNGKLYFNASAGKGTSGDPLPYKELHVTDGSTDSTILVFDANPAYNKQANPQEMFVLKNKLYMQINDGTSTQYWSYDGENTPVKLECDSNKTWFSPSKAIVDTDKAWFKGTNGKAQLWTLSADGTYTQLTSNSSQNGYGGVGVLYKGGLLFSFKNDSKDVELWYSDGTADGTGLVLDLDTAASSSPKEYTIFNDEAYFVATVGGLSQLWKTDASTEGTVVVYAPEDTLDTEIENLSVINNKLVFTANTSEGISLFKLADSGAEELAQVADSPEDFYLHDGLLFFVAGDALWYTEGTTASTMAVSADIFESGVVATAVDGGEFVSNGTKLSFVSEADGRDVITTIDAADITRDPAADITTTKATKKEVTVFPMPTSGLINIQSEISFTSYKIFDLSMKQIMNSPLQGTQLNVSLEKGIYILQLENSDNIVAKTIMIQ